MVQDGSTRRAGRLTAIGLGVGGLVLIAGGYLAFAVDFTDWEQVHDQCLAGGEYARERDAAIEACARLSESGRFSGAQLGAIHLAHAQMEDDAGNRAIPVYEAAVEADPTLVEAWRRIAQDRALRSPQSAIEALDVAIPLAPDDAELRQLRGLALVQDGRAEEAIPDLELAVAANPDEMLLHTGLAAAHTAIGNYQAAIDAADTALAMPPPPTGGTRGQALAVRDRQERVVALNIRGTAQHFLGSHAEALDSFRQSVDRQERQSWARLGVISAQCGLGDDRAAWAAIAATVDQPPQGGIGTQTPVYRAAMWATDMGLLEAPSAYWRTLMIHLGYLQEDAPHPEPETELGTAMEGALRAWMDDGCPLQLDPIPG